MTKSDPASESNTMRFACCHLGLFIARKLKPRHQKSTWNLKFSVKTFISITLQGLSWLIKNLMATLRLDNYLFSLSIAMSQAHLVMDILLSWHILVGNGHLSQTKSQTDKSEGQAHSAKGAYKQEIWPHENSQKYEEVPLICHGRMGRT